jgi:hypothetical protein
MSYASSEENLVHREPVQCDRGSLQRDRMKDWPIEYMHDTDYLGNQKMH